jgi:hypothetical protein
MGTEQSQLQDKDQGEKGKGPRQNNKMWGPIQVVRKSTRQAGNEETALEKAQKLKRKANLEENPSNQAKHSNVLSHTDILSLAKNIDIGIKSSYDSSNIVKNIIDLDRNRISTFSFECKDSWCNEVGVEERHHQMVQGVAPATPPDQIKEQKLEVLIEAFSAMVPRKQITRKKRNDRSILEYKRSGLAW